MSCEFKRVEMLVEKYHVSHYHSSRFW